jgi:hypothetical protein
MPDRGFVDFGRSLWIYYKYILPYTLLFVNILLVASKYKVLNRILLAIIYAVFIGWYWGSMMFGAYSYPYRALLVLLILTVYYAFDLFIINKIGNRIKYKNKSPNEKNNNHFNHRALVAQQLCATRH